MVNSKFWKPQHIGCFFIAIITVAICSHFYGCIPTSRLGPRSFVMGRDYKDMERVFGITPIPESLKIEAVSYPFGRAMMDGPPPVLYKANVLERDYDSLIRAVKPNTLPIDHRYNRLASVSHFNPNFQNDLLILKWEPVMAPDGTTVTTAELYENTTPGKDGYPSTSYILADLRTSDPVTLYITTWVPFSE